MAAMERGRGMTRANYALRLQSGLKAEAERVAKREGTTLNQFINVAVAEKLSADSRAKRNGLSEADLDVPAKLLEQRLEGRQEAEALPRRQVVAEHDLLQLGVGQGVQVEVARQVAAQPPVRVLRGSLLPGGVGVAEPGRHRAGA